MKVWTRKAAQPTTDLHHWEDDSKHLVTKLMMFVQVAGAGVLLEHVQPRPVRDCQHVARPGAGTNRGWRSYCWSILPDERLARVVHGAFSRGTTRVSHRGLVIIGTTDPRPWPAIPRIVQINSYAYIRKRYGYKVHRRAGCNSPSF